MVGRIGVCHDVALFRGNLVTLCVSGTYFRYKREER